MSVREWVNECERESEWVSEWVSEWERERVSVSEWCTSTLVQEVGEEAAHDGLVADDHHVALSLQLHDNWLQPLHQILIGLQQEKEKTRC